ELHLQHARELLGELGLADTGWTGKQEVPHRLVGGAESRSRQLDGGGHLFDGRVLPENHRLQFALEVLERHLVVARHGLHGDASAGFSRLPASIVPPDADPAPTSVWISSMNRIACGCLSSASSTCLTRSSKSPR